jgi:tetratricopeptide (TPR) repeat protein
MNGKVTKVFDGLLSGAATQRQSRNAAVGLLRRYPMELLPGLVTQLGIHRGRGRDDILATLHEWLGTRPPRAVLLFFITRLLDGSPREHDLFMAAYARVPRLRLSQTHHERLWREIMRTHASEVLRQAGQLEVALRQARQAVRRLLALRSENSRAAIHHAFALSVLSNVRADRGDASRALDDAEAAVRLLPRRSGPGQTMWMRLSVLAVSAERLSERARSREALRRFAGAERLLEAECSHGRIPNELKLMFLIRKVQILENVGEHNASLDLSRSLWDSIGALLAEYPGSYSFEFIAFARLYCSLLLRASRINDAADVSQRTLASLAELAKKNDRDYLRPYLEELLLFGSYSLAADRLRESRDAARLAFEIIPPFESVNGGRDFRIEGKAFLLASRVHGMDGETANAVKACNTALRCFRRLAVTDFERADLLGEAEEVREALKELPKRACGRVAAGRISSRKASAA